jgi:hypothetical protein
MFSWRKMRDFMAVNSDAGNTLLVADCSNKTYCGGIKSEVGSTVEVKTCLGRLKNTY